MPEAPTATIPLYAIIPPRLLSRPRFLVVPETRTDDWEAKVDLVWDGGAPGHIKEVVTSDAPLSARAVEKDGHQQIVLTVPQAFEFGPEAHLVTVLTDDATAPMLTIPIRLHRKAKKRPPSVTAGRRRGVITKGTAASGKRRAPARAAKQSPTASNGAKPDGSGKTTPPAKAAPARKTAPPAQTPASAKRPAATKPD